MASHAVPHFQNSGGHKQVSIGAKEFMCIGANPPFDHPHIFLDMGADTEVVCPYCSTHYVYDSALAPTQATPSDCVWIPDAAAQAAE
ncbi:zinc-finger domain-containing protein [Polycladidibacter hongkongensis]|uniref:zinc-finger domain-containing protein n=1 Tax=Polycladidibacter hongkongensis TaxID=1647556 RepID=UPI000836FB6C|nr:zinc-finger domain-containing protein [Pseudovibrio hongkongensis]